MSRLMLVPLVLSLYVVWRLKLPLRRNGFWHMLIALLMVLGLNEFTLLYHVYGGFYFCPDAPRTLLLVWNGLFMTALFVTVALLLLEIVRIPAALAMMMISPRVRRLWKRFNSYLNALILMLAALLSLYGEYAAMSQPVVRELTVRLPHYPKGTAPLKVALLADIHADGIKRAPFLAELVRRVNALGADAILISGDFVDGSLEERADDLLELRGLRAPLGVYGVTGNHDVYYGNEQWVRFLQQRAGVRMLMNEHIPLGSIVLAGVPDISTRPRKEATEPDLRRALSGVASGSCIVLLAHQPKFAREAAAAHLPVDLQLSGHTHGGQIRFLDNLWAKFNDGYVAGLYRVRGSEGMQLYVSRGTSLWSPTGFRIGVPPEIVLLTLCAEE